MWFMLGDGVKCSVLDMKDVLFFNLAVDTICSPYKDSESLKGQ